MGSRVMQLSCQTHYIHGQNLQINEQNCKFEFLLKLKKKFHDFYAKIQIIKAYLALKNYQKIVEFSLKNSISQF